MSHAELNVTPMVVAGLIIPTGESLSKRQRIDLALKGLTERQLADLALKFSREPADIVLDEAARKELEADDPPLTRITRRDVARVFGDDLAGEHDTLPLVEKYFVLSSPLEMFAIGVRGGSLRDRIERHMNRNPGD